ncbi:C-type lectin BpLec-like, partial [Emydura macquarii macquarii]|uniref:C-type lectin BpLec-like n=1 Tax=Emydura macquarii macquarii TaxID=1129001 RepID=UPI00352AC5E2
LLTAPAGPHRSPLASALSIKAQDASCPVGWIHSHNNCYGYFSQEKTWMDAEVECQRHWHGAHLASIHSTGENDILAHYVQRHHKNTPVWIGLWDPDQNLNWRWADESLVNFFAWDNGQPDGPKKKEHCVVLSHSTGFQKWHDYPCKDKFSFICKNKAKGRKLARTGGLPMPGLVHQELLKRMASNLNIELKELSEEDNPLFVVAGLAGPSRVALLVHERVLKLAKALWQTPASIASTSKGTEKKY